MAPPTIQVEGTRVEVREPAERPVAKSGFGAGLYFRLTLTDLPFVKFDVDFHLH